MEKVKIIDDKTEKKEEKWREREAELEELKEQRAAVAKEFKEKQELVAKECKGQQESVAKELKEQQEAGAKEVVKLKSMVSSLEFQVKELKQEISAAGPALTREEEVIQSQAAF